MRELLDEMAGALPAFSWGMFNVQWLSGAAALVAACAALGACGGSSASSDTGAVLAGAAGADGSAGSGSVDDQPGGTSDAPCQRALDCANSSDAYQCPSSADALIATLCAMPASYGGTYTRLGSSCGGTIISAGYGFHAQTWSFDASNQLTGGTYQEDTPLSCSDGSQSFKSVTGEVCAPQGEPEALCATL
jgi:hypothetical protein